MGEHKSTYLAETETFIYYRGSEQEIVMYRKSDNKEFPVDEVNEGELITDCLEGKIIKLAPAFVYDYVEILKENGKLLIELLE